MIRVSIPGAGLVQRLRRRAQSLADGHLHAARRRARSDWHSAAALWPDFVADNPRI